MKPWKRLLIGLALGCFVSAEPGEACTCSAPASAAEALEQSSAVFRGKVTRIGRPLLDRIGITKSGNHRVRFEILKRWKGARSRSVTVNTRLSGEACGFPFEANQEYLVYVVAGRGKIETGICTGTKHAASAELEMQQLDGLLAGRSR